MMKLLGVDGCRAGWVVASSDIDLAGIEFDTIGDHEIGGLFERSANEGDLVAIDIPIGLADAAPRGCDLAARKYLKPPRASSVFPAPCRAALPATSYQEACELNYRASGRKMSKQAFAILGKIRQVDAAITPELQDRVRESHPEVVFARLLGERRGLSPPKRTLDGRMARRRLLGQRLPPFDEEDIVQRLGRSNLKIDDLFDALARLVAAQNIVRCDALVLPEGIVELDSRGLRMEIVA